MTAHSDWVPAHVLTLTSTVLLALGLWAARAGGSWPAATRRALTFAAVCVSVYVLESAFHLAAFVDSDALAHGESAPVAMTHVGLSIVLYPLTGAAITRLAVSYGRALGGWRLLVAGVGALAGLALAAAVPLSILLPDTEISPVFAAAGILTALWSLGTAAGGARPSPGRARRSTAGSDRVAVSELVG